MAATTDALDMNDSAPDPLRSLEEGLRLYLRGIHIMMKEYYDNPNFYTHENAEEYADENVGKRLYELEQLEQEIEKLEAFKKMPNNTDLKVADLEHFAWRVWVWVWDKMNGEIEETRRQMDALKSVCSRAELVQMILQNLYARDKKIGGTRDWGKYWADIVDKPVLEEQQKELDAAIAAHL
jgi:hypothetical protein